MNTKTAYVLMVVGGAVVGSGIGYYSATQSMASFIIMAVGAIILGISIAAVMANRKKQKQADAFALANGLTGDGQRKSVCPNCGLNVISGTPHCPRCNTPFDWSM